LLTTISLTNQKVTPTVNR